MANSLKRFVPLFDPIHEAILAHQNRTMVRHADETGWRVQEFRDNGRSSRAWLWTSVSKDAVYFHIDPSRSAEVAKILFGDTDCTVFVVCDRYSAYRKLARELDGKAILCFCWAHQRRTFVECAAGHARLARWCEGWIERIGEIYQLNDERLKHYDASLERQTPAFDAARVELKKAVKRLFADAEAKLADLTIGIGGSLAAPPLPHHRAYGSVHGGSTDLSDRAVFDRSKAEPGEEGVRHRVGERGAVADPPWAVGTAGGLRRQVLADAEAA